MDWLVIHAVGIADDDAFALSQAQHIDGRVIIAVGQQDPFVCDQFSFDKKMMH